jgi:hypothetical protein
VGRGRVHSPDEKQDVLCKPHEHETEYSICITQAEGRVTQQPIVRLLTAALPGPACFTQLPSRLEIISHKDKCHYRSLGRVPLLLVLNIRVWWQEGQQAAKGGTDIRFSVYVLNIAYYSL